MAEGVSSPSVGVRIFLIVALLCLSWLSNGSVNAADNTDIGPQGVAPAPSQKQAIGALARDILDELYSERHRPLIDELLKRLDRPDLTDGEALWKKANPEWSRDGELSNKELRLKIIDYMWRERAYQTIAVGVDPVSKKIVIAGNIKAFDFWNIKGKMTKNRETKVKELTIVGVKITDVGFRESDYPIIRDIVAKAYPEHNLIVVSPSEEDMGKLPQTDSDRAQTYHAEMQIQTYFEKHGDMTLDNKQIVASKPYCKNCRENLPPDVIDEMMPPGYDGKNMRWEEPENVNVRELGVTPAQSDTNSKISGSYQDLIEKLQESGGSCGGRGSRRRRSLCNSLEDFTEINADEFHKKIQDLSEGDREKLLSALEDVGMDRLHGSESVMKEIDYSYKKWKSSVAKGVMEAVSKGTIIFELLRGVTRSTELEKTAISPKILSESMNQLQEQELESLAKEYEKFKTGEMDEPKSFKGFSFSYKFVKRVNLAMFGKNLIGGVLDGDPDSVIAMGGLFVADRGLNEVGEMIASKGVKMVEAGHKVLGTTLKIAGPIVGSLTIGFSIYSFVGHINELNYLEKFCQRNDSLFQDRLKSDCKFDMDITIANTVADEVGIISGAVVIAEGILGLLSVDTGPVGIVFAVIDALVAIGTQIYAAVETVAKISSSLVGGLSGHEKLTTGWRTFWGMSPPPPIEHLMDIKKSYNTDVAMAVEILKKADKFQTYVAPTTHTRNHVEVNCKWESRPVSAGRVFADIFSLGIAETHYSKKVKKCDIKQEFEDDSEADFQNWQQLHQFRVEPDTPSWGNLECKPNSLASQRYTNDPEYHGVTNGYLCHNVIAMSAPERSALPVLVDLKDGTDRMLGFSNRKHVFLVEGGTKSFTAADADDVFVMKSFPFNGQFDGAGGKNTLVLDDDQVPTMSIDLSSVCQPSSSCENQVKNFQQVIGRSNKSDVVVTACSTSYVDLNGGESTSNPDRITIPSSACKTSPVFQLRQFTKLENNHDVNGDFVYEVEFGSGIEAKFKPEKNAHRFIFSNDIITANLSLESGIFVMEKEGQEFKSNFITSENFTLMTQAGLSINFDEDTESFFGVATPSNQTKEVNGLVKYPNRFILATNESLKIKGGEKDDIFSFTGTNNKPSGSVDGSGGVDSIVIQQDFHPDKTVSFDFATKVLSPGGIQLSNIENVIGRRALAEDIQVTCSAKWLDLGGGTGIHSDVIRIPPQASCSSEITLMVRNFTTVENLATSGDFNYRIDLENSAETNSIQVNRSGNATHNYIFQRNSSSVSQIDFNATSGLFKIQFQNESWSGTVVGERSTVYLADQIAVEVIPEVHGVVQVQSNSTVNMTGLHNYPNTFVLGAASKDSNCTGGQKDDSFFVFSENFFGTLIGGKGNNAIILMDGIRKGQPMIMNGINKTVSVRKGTEVEDQVGFSGIQRFFGRVGESDVIFPGCDTALIDTRGGPNGSSVYDLIQISSFLECYLDLDVAIRPNLIVFNDATEGEFGYEGDFRGGNTSIFLTFSETADHNVILAMDFLHLERLKIHQGRVNMTALNNSQFSIDFFMPAGTHTHTQPSIVFQDGLQLKVSHYGHHSSAVFGILRNVSSSDVVELKQNIETSGLIQRYRKTAKDTRTSVVMQVENGTLVSIGSGGRIDILTAAPGYTNNILVCNDANETIYRIANGSANVQILTHLHSIRPKVLDFTDIIKDNHVIVPTVKMAGMDLTFFGIEDVKVTVKRLADANSEDLKSWQVLLRETYLNIERDSEEGFKLVPISILVKPKEHDNVVLNTPNLEYDMKILTLNDSDPISYERLKQGNSLVFTNLFKKDLSKEVATVVFHQFYNEDVANTLDEKRVVFEVEPGVFINVTTAIGENLPTFEEREWEVFGRTNPMIWILPLVAVVLIVSIAAAWWSKKTKEGYQPIGSTEAPFSSWSMKRWSGSPWQNKTERDPLCS